MIRWDGKDASMVAGYLRSKFGDVTGKLISMTG